MPERVNQGDEVGHRGGRQLGRGPDRRGERGQGQAKLIAIPIVDQEVRRVRRLARQGRRLEASPEERMRRVEDDDVLLVRYVRTVGVGGGIKVMTRPQEKRQTRASARAEN